MPVAQSVHCLHVLGTIIQVARSVALAKSPLTAPAKANCVETSMVGRLSSTV